MKARTFLPLLTYPEPSCDALAPHAVALAAWIAGEVHALALNVDIPPVSNALSRLLLNVPEMIREAEAASRKHGERLLHAVEKAGADKDVVVTTGKVAAPLALVADLAAVHARYFDLAMVGWEAGNPTSRLAAESIIFGSGRPMVLLPDECELRDLEHVGIAWDGGRAAARAVGDAMPFLERASRITVFTVLDEKPLGDKDTGERLAGGLRERGLRADRSMIEAGNLPVSDAIQQRAVEAGCGMLIMGAFGHSRLREFVLGGATEGVLGDALMPILLSH